MVPISRLLCYKRGSGGCCDNTQPTVATEISRGKHHFVKQVPSPISQDAYRNLQMCLFLRRMRPRRSRIGRGRVNCYNGGNRNFPGNWGGSLNFVRQLRRRSGSTISFSTANSHVWEISDDAGRNLQKVEFFPGNFCCHRWQKNMRFSREKGTVATETVATEFYKREKKIIFLL